jgi:hypothetical protein
VYNIYNINRDIIIENLQKTGGLRVHILTGNSPYAHWQSLPLNSVSVKDGFWAHKQTINRSVSLRTGYRKLHEFGNFDNLRFAAGLAKGEYKGPAFMDSDVYKWLEAVAYDLARSPDAELKKMASEAIDLVAATQQPDGYINSYWQYVKPDERWRHLDWGHELYCAGHLFEAAVAFHRATGETRLLNIARRLADHIISTFVPSKQLAACGHPEVELALVELYRETGEKRYLDQALFFINQRGKNKMGKQSGPASPGYFQDRVPVREANIVEGHAVRQLYLTSGVTDIYMETGEQTLLDAMNRLWIDMTGTKMHLTGGFGARHELEAFGEAYELPSDRCYCETCATIAAIMWNWRMLLATGEARYADLMERCLYNGFLSGVSADGQRYFYVNPLMSRGGIERPEWYNCACCPPNVMRQIAMIGNYVASVDNKGVQVHQYIPSTVKTKFADLGIKTDYPMKGKITFTVKNSNSDKAWQLSLRIPQWCYGAILQLNGKKVPAAKKTGYISIKRLWHKGDIIELELPMHPNLIAVNPRVDAVRSSLAIEYGPFVYCLEEIDQEPEINFNDIRITQKAELKAVWRKDLLGGIMAITVQGKLVDDTWGNRLYGRINKKKPSARDINLTAIPYFAWANRGPGAMRVWIPIL